MMVAPGFSELLVLPSPLQKLERSHVLDADRQTSPKRHAYVRGCPRHEILHAKDIKGTGFWLQSFDTRQRASEGTKQIYTHAMSRIDQLNESLTLRRSCMNMVL